MVHKKKGTSFKTSLSRSHKRKVSQEIPLAQQQQTLNKKKTTTTTKNQRNLFLSAEGKKCCHTAFTH